MRALASLIRNGSVDKALEREAHSALKSLGKLLPDGVVLVRDLPRNFLWRTFWFIVKVHHPSSAGDASYVVSDAVVFQKFLYAMNVTSHALISFSHPHPEFETPLMHVMSAEYEALGKRLGGINPDTIASIGYWHFEKTERRVYFEGNDGMYADCGIPQSELDNAKDWKIDKVDDYYNACLVSDTRGLAKKCTTIFRDAGVDIPEPRKALDGSRNSVPRELASIDVPAKVIRNRPARAKGKAKAKSVASAPPPKAPKRPTTARPQAR